MTNDEQLIQAMRAMSTDVPQIALDHEETLRRGRHRRTVRSVGTTVGVGVLCVGLYLGGAAALGQGRSTPPVGNPAPSQTPAPSPSPSAPHAVVDPATGTVSLPMDQWNLTQRELDSLTSAVEVYATNCLTAAGYGDGVDLTGPAHMPMSDNAASYGMWRDSVLEERGYENPPDTTSHNAFRGIKSEAGMAQMRACYQEALKQGLSYDPMDFEGVAPEGYKSSDQTPEGKSVIAEWSRCLVSNGLTPPGENQGLFPADVFASADMSQKVPLAEQIRIGRIDIACKEKTDFVQRMADIDAAQQERYIQINHDYLVQLRGVQQAALTKAQAYLASQGLSMDDPTW